MAKISKVQLEAKRTRFKIFKYIEAHEGWVNLKQLEADMQSTHAKVYYHIKTLQNERYVAVEKRRIPELNKVVNLMVKAIAIMPDDYVNEQDYVEPVKKEEVPSHVRVVRLLDNPLKRPEESKKKATVHIGSGMSLFNNY